MQNHPTIHFSHMNRSEIVLELANRFGQLPQRDVEHTVTLIIDAMATALARGQRIDIRGFGSFSINNMMPRIGRNPRNGNSVAIAAKRVTRFKPGKALREAVDFPASEPTKVINEQILSTL